MEFTESKKRNKAIFLDRDGVINKIVYRDQKISCPYKLEEFELIDGVKSVIRSFKEMGFYIFIITNQPDISRGNLLQSDLDKINMFIKHNLLIDQVFVCPHDNNDNCDCRKPKPGMITRAAQSFDIDLTRSFLIGDSNKDIMAAHEAGVWGILIDTDYNKDFFYKTRVATLEQAFNIVCERERSGNIFRYRQI